MNILMITENDPAGMGIAFKNAINCHTDHNCRLITKSTRYDFHFEKDIHVPDLLTRITTDSADSDGFDEIEQLLRDADIIHFHILADENITLGPIKVKDFIHGKAILHHHHGHPDFRAHPEKYGEKYRKLKRKVIVSTPDLLRLLPEATWQPNLVPIDSPPYLPPSGVGNGRIRICHSPTRKDLKNTAEFESVVRSLQKKYSNIEGVILENKPHRDCLMIKQACHIHFDHMQGYFGVSSLEGLSQGKPVIAGLDEWNIRHIKGFSETDYIPWVIARSQTELKNELEKLVLDKEFSEYIGKKSRRFVERYWNDQHTVQTLMEIYETI